MSDSSNTPSSAAADQATAQQATAEQATVQVDATQAAPRIKRSPRRATTQPVPGSDPRPAPEPARHTLTENDDRLKAEKPPHY